MRRNTWRLTKRGQIVRDLIVWVATVIALWFIMSFVAVNFIPQG
jgi:uncharacterized membrane protein